MTTLDQSLIDALEASDSDAALLALAQDASMYSQNEDGESAVSIAVTKGLLEVIEAMLNIGMPVDLGADEDDMTPLYAACFGESLRSPEIVDMLLARGADPNIVWAKESAPLAIALDTDHDLIVRRRIVSSLITHGADYEAPRADGFRPLMLAASTGDVVLIDLLLDAGADPHATRVGVPDVTAWCVADYKGHKEVMVRLEDEGVKCAAQPGQAVRAVWTHIAQAFDAQGASTLSAYIHEAKGASSDAIASVEAHLGVTLPAYLKAHWAAFGGCSMLSIWEYSLLTVEGVLARLRLMSELAQDTTWCSQQPRELDVSAQRIKPLWWHPMWLPIAEDGGGNLICLDLAPAIGGARGQVIYWEVHAGPVGPMRSDLMLFLEDYLTRVQSGAWTYSEDDGLFEG